MKIKLLLYNEPIVTHQNFYKVKKIFVIKKNTFDFKLIT